MSQNVPTLYNINMKIQKGEMVGIVGPSGAGKTTLVDILLGVLKFEAGEVLLDNTPLSVNNIWAWREIVGYVPQDGFLLNDNVRNNIKFFKDIPDPDIISAAKFADADGFINEMTNGYDSILGDNGINLSGGQRQRIVLARALAGNPQILILDEATSSLDTESENKIQLAIEKLRNKLTIIVIAHRLSTILNADNIFVLKDGRIVEEGASSELIDNGKTFYKLYMKQGFEKN
jgi:ATP-binding cassette subfamily C protein